MNDRYKNIELAGLNKKLQDYKYQATELKNKFFDYIEGLNSEFKIFSNINKQDFSFEIYGNKLKLRTTFHNNETTNKGRFSALILTITEFNNVYKELLTCNFDYIGNVTCNDINYNIEDFAEQFFIQIMNKLIESNNFEL